MKLTSSQGNYGSFPTQNLYGFPHREITRVTWDWTRESECVCSVCVRLFTFTLVVVERFCYRHSISNKMRTNIIANWTKSQRLTNKQHLSAGFLSRIDANRQAFRYLTRLTVGRFLQRLMATWSPVFRSPTMRQSKPAYTNSTWS
jgi:hypothetical protein